MRKILHVDMDAFFAAVEQRDNPALKGLPVIIGGEPNTRGVVSTCSYEARRFGVHSAMSLTEAYRRCPHGVFLHGNHAKYRKVSGQIRSIFDRYTPLVEPLSIDEAFLDVTGCEKLFGPLPTIAKKVKATIKEELDLTASVGAAPNKFLAKIASDLQKPDGLVIVESDKVKEFLYPLPIRRLWGVGSSTAERLERLGFATVGDIARVDLKLLEQHFGKAGTHLYRLSHGIDDRPVITSHEIKSVSHEHTFTFDTGDMDEIVSTLIQLCERVARRLRQAEVKGRTITLKLRFSDFKTLTRSTTLYQPTDFDTEVVDTALKLFRQIDLVKPIRLIGVAVSKLHYPEEGRQMTLFENDFKKKKQLGAAIDNIKDKFGENMITSGKTIKTED